MSDTKATQYLATLLLFPTVATAEPYLALRGGTQWWNDTSNSDPLEDGTEPGHTLALAVGDEAGLSDIGLPKSDFALDLELEAAWRREPLHGRNRGTDHRTADGHDLDLYSLGANLWPGWQFTRRLTVSVGGGGGYAINRALGDTDGAPWGQAGASVRANLTPELSLEAGYRCMWLDDVKPDGYRATYGAVHGLLLGVRWEFKGE